MSSRTAGPGVIRAGRATHPTTPDLESTMTDRSTGPRCGNNPNTQLTDGDRKVVDAFRAQLALREAAKPYIERAVWEDGDPLMEVIASTLWEHCARDDQEQPQAVCDDPRTIAAFAAAVAKAHAATVPATADRAGLRDRIAEAIYAHYHPSHVVPLDGTGMGPTYRETADAVLAVLPASADRAAVLREEAALIRAHCPDHLDSNSADGSWINCHCDVADDMERRAAESAPATAPQSVRHAPGKAILCPDCRSKGHSVCMAAERHAAAQQPICKCPAEICQCGHHKAQQPKEA